jgi:DNA-binding beta-propeller fold protein YncE
VVAALRLSHSLNRPGHDGRRPDRAGLDAHGTLFVADSAGNAIAAIPSALVRNSDAGTGTMVTTAGNLNTPLGRAIAPNGDVLTVNAGDDLLAEMTPAGIQIDHRFLDKSGSPAGSGALFGLALTPRADGIYCVDGAVNTLRLLH